jgi:hypothetical protein
MQTMLKYEIKFSAMLNMFQEVRWTEVSRMHDILSALELLRTKGNLK